MPTGLPKIRPRSGTTLTEDKPWEHVESQGERSSSDVDTPVIEFPQVESGHESDSSDTQRSDLSEFAKGVLEGYRLALAGKEAADTAVSVEEFVSERDLTPVLSRIERLVHAEFGDRAYIEVRLECDWETGENELVVEAHYNLADPEQDLDELVDKDRRLVDQYVSEFAPEHRRQIVFTSVPTDADTA